MPEGRDSRLRVEAQHFLHAAIAIGRDDEELAGNRSRWRGEPENEVVMELTLLCVVEQNVAAARRVDACKESAEAEFRCESVDGFHATLYGPNGLQVSG